MKDYLRNRPFLCVTFSYVPSSTANTSVKGWMNEPGAMKVLNKVTIVDRVNSKAETASSIIIDIIDSKCIKNTTQAPNEEVMEKYLSEYSEDIVKALGVWAESELGRRGEEVASADSN